MALKVNLTKNKKYIFEKIYKLKTISFHKFLYTNSTPKLCKSFKITTLKMFQQLPQHNKYKNRIICPCLW
jgi:hypothetical protein